MKKFKRKVLAMLMTNNFGSSLRQQLFDSAPFCSELLYTAIPQRAASGTTGTFTRATTKTWQNNDGYLVTGVAGEIGFPGARRVHNLINTTDSSEVMSVNDITSYPVTIIPSDIAPPPGYTQADRQTTTGALGRKGALTTWSSSVAAGRVLLMQCVAKAGSGRYLVFGDQADSNWHVMTLDTQTGTVNVVGDAFSPGVEDLGDGWFKIWFRFTKNIAGGVNMLCCHADLATNGAYPFINAGEYWWATGFQIEDVTAQTTQEAGEYVSVGVESAPYYHGSFVDGVKCFPTDLAGNPLTTMLGYQAQGARTNLCLQSNAFTTTWTTSGTVTASQNAVGPSGAANEAWTLGDTDAAVLSDFRQELVIANDAVLRGMQVRVGKTVGATTFPGVGVLLLGGTTVAGQWAVNTNLGTLTARSSNVGTVAATIESAGNFWLIKMSATNNSTGNVTARIQMFPSVNADASATWVTSTVGTAVFAYAGFEVGWPSSYIATTTIAVARNADVLTYSSAGNILGTAGWAYCEIKTGSACGRALSFNAGGTGMIDAVTGDSLSFRAYDETNVVNVTAGDSSASTVKQAIAWGGSTLSAARNGTTASGSFDGNMSPTGISIGGTTGGELNGTIRNVRIGQRQLSTSELQAITS